MQPYIPEQGSIGQLCHRTQHISVSWCTRDPRTSRTQPRFDRTSTLPYHGHVCSLRRACVRGRGCQRCRTSSCWGYCCASFSGRRPDCLLRQTRSWYAASNGVSEDRHRKSTILFLESSQPGLPRRRTPLPRIRYLQQQNVLVSYSRT